MGAGRFSCGWPLDHVVEALLTSKREDLTQNSQLSGILCWELLDAGFNVSMVAERQGHGPQVLNAPLLQVPGKSRGIFGPRMR